MIDLTGHALTPQQVISVARHHQRVRLGEAARVALETSAEVVAELNRTDTVAYGITTGFGALADVTIAPADRAGLQRALVLSHAAGMGDPLPEELVRGMLLLRARTLCAGYSGVRVAVVEAILALLNHDIPPWVPRHGSLGASGDLAPLAHAAAVLLGEGQVVGHDGAPASAAAALTAAGLSPLTLGPKEGLALINGTDAMTAALTLALEEAEQLLVAADCAAAMSIEALLATPAVFDAALIALRRGDGPTASATNLRALLRHSEIAQSHAQSHHAVQDAYSLRCSPQVHGAARDLFRFCRQVLDRELDSVVDNPVVMAETSTVRSTGNFHGQSLAYAADCCAMLVADLAAISERRVDRLLDATRSRGLPAFLTAAPGLNSGLMIAQYTAAAVVSRLRTLATPLSVQSMSTSAGQEDHVSMGFEAALRTLEAVHGLRSVIAVEMVCAAQALELRAPLAPAPGTAALLANLRLRVPHLEEDRVIATDLEAADAWLASGEWRTTTEATTGALQ